MKVRISKIILFAMSIVFCMSLTVGCANGCTDEPSTPPLPYEEREVGDFVVRFYDDYCEIKGTTEQGNSRKFLVIPEYIDGVRVESLGVYDPLYDIIFSTDLNPPEIKSNNLEKVYFESNIKVSDLTNSYCPNLKKVMYPVLEVDPYCMDRSEYTVYYPRSIYDENNWQKIPTSPANVSYYYNYENAEKGGYYWIDDCDYGSKIEFIPKDPTREGFIFDGWYKETNCQNRWCFETDTLPEEKTERIYYETGEFWDKTVYQETILFAKWNKI